MSGSPAGSYPDAYAKVFAKDSNRPVSRGSYAEAHARKQSPSPAKRQEYYSPTVGAELAWRARMHACKARMVGMVHKATTGIANTQGMLAVYSFMTCTLSDSLRAVKEVWQHPKPAYQAITEACGEPGHPICQGQGCI